MRKPPAFFKAIAVAPAATVLPPSLTAKAATADLPKAKITRVRIYRPPDLNPLFNQSNMIVTVETDIGITGIGEGGSKDTLEQCAGTLIGKNPFHTAAIWQEMYISWFYPPGREKTDAIGALDSAAILFFSWALAFAPTGVSHTHTTSIKPNFVTKPVPPSFDVGASDARTKRSRY